MPLVKNGQGVLVETPVIDKDLFEETGVIRGDMFAISDAVDKTKQIQFDASPLSGDGVLTIEAPAAGDVTITMPATSGTLALVGGGGGGDSFNIIQPITGTSPTATGDSTLTLTSTDNSVSIAGDATADSLNFSVTKSSIGLGSVTNDAQLKIASNLSDLNNAGTARTNLGLGGAATLSVGTTAGTVAAGDDSRITGAAQKSSNLSDLASASTSRTNLGISGANTPYTPATSGFWSTVPADVAAALDWLAKYHPHQLQNSTALQDDWLYNGTAGSLDWTVSANSGAVAMDTTLVDTAHHGIVRLSTSTSSSASPSLISLVNQIQLGGGVWEMDWLIYITTLSDGTETYTIRFGFGESFTSAAHTDGVWLEYTHSVNSGNWTLQSMSNTTPTTTNSSIAVTTGWHHLRIVVNAAASSAEGFIDGVSTGTVAGLPSGAGRATAVSAIVTKSAGTTARLFYIDAFRLRYLPTSARW